MTKSTILFFDLDGTLVEHTIGNEVSKTLQEQMAEQTGFPWRQFRQETYQESQERYQKNPNHPQTMDWDDIFETVATRHGVQLPDPFLDLWRQFLKTMPERVEILDEAPNVLKQLKNGRRTLVLATKGLSKYQNPILELAGLDTCFDDILTPDITGYLKTEPGYFERYADRENRLFIQVGDHYYDDVICAKRNGFVAILRAEIPELATISPFDRPQQLEAYSERVHCYPDEPPSVKPDAVVVNLNELPAVIDTIEAGF